MYYYGGSELAPGRQTSTPDTGAIYTAEAAVAAILLISTLAAIMYVQPGNPGQSTEDLRTISSDLLNILEYRSNLPAHPSLAHVISSQADWGAKAPVLEADIRSVLPPGTRFYMTTPVGSIGDVPPDYAQKYVRPFEAFMTETNTIVECKLTIWRG